MAQRVMHPDAVKKLLEHATSTDTTHVMSPEGQVVPVDVWAEGELKRYHDRAPDAEVLQFDDVSAEKLKTLGGELEDLMKYVASRFLGRVSISLVVKSHDVTDADFFLSNASPEEVMATLKGLIDNKNSTTVRFH